MARSSYVYVVLKDGVPVHGATVKRELLFWAHRHRDSVDVIWRVPDANPRLPIVDVTKEYMGE